MFKFSLKKIEYFFILMIIIYPFLWISKGIELVDSGEAIFHYKQIFNNHYFFTGLVSPKVLSCIIGGLWIKLFPFMEYTSCKIAAVLISIFICFILYKTFKDIFTNKTLLLFSLFISTIFITRPFVQFLNYSNLSVLFFVIGGYYLYYGLIKNSNKKIFISSVILSLNIFIRFPNILGFVFVLAPLYWAYINIKAKNILDKEEIRNEYKNSLVSSGYFLTGYLLTIAIFLIILKISGMLQGFWEGCETLNYLAKADATHSLFGLSNMYFNVYCNTLKVSAIYIAIIFVIQKLIEITKKIVQESLKISPIFEFAGLMLILLVLLVIIPIVLYPRDMYPIFIDGKLDLIYLISNSLRLIATPYFWKASGQFLIIGLFLIIPLFVIFYKKIDTKLKLISIIGLLVSFFSFAGSDAYFLYVPGYWIISVISIYFALSPKNFVYINEENNKKIKVMGVIFITALVISAIFESKNQSCFFDSRFRSYMNYKVNSNKFNGSYTTIQRATVLNELIAAYPKFIKKDDYLIAWPNIALIHYITETNPALKWPGSTDYKIFKDNLREIESKKIYPAVIISKFNSHFEEWPRILVRYYKPNKACSSIVRADARSFCYQKLLLDKYIIENKYQKVWENVAFEIYTKE